MVVRSTQPSGKTSASCPGMGPLKVFSVTVVTSVGTPKTLAALASPTALFIRSWRSVDCTPKNICGS